MITCQPDGGLRGGHRRSHNYAPPDRAHGRLRVGDHEEDEELVHRAGERRDFRQQWTAHDQAAHGGERDEARDVGQGDMEHADARDDEEPEAPDHRVRRQLITPLMAEDGHARRRHEDEHADGEVARVPEMTAAVLQDVLGRDREEPAEDERPQQIGAWFDQQRETDAGDVGALHVREAPPQEPRQDQLGRGANAQRRNETVVPPEDAVARFAEHQDERDEERDRVARIEPPQPGPQSAGPAREGQEGGVAHGRHGG